ncbi:MAG: cation diffusion facilitator family transporter [Desulfatiglandaceae bacterium]
MGHDHSHAAKSTARLFITMMLNFAITVAEVIGGIISGSLSLISDALHNFSDGIAIIVAYIAIRLSERTRTESYTFGLKRAEIIAAVINSAVLVAICFFLIREAYERFISPEPIKGALMVGVASIGLLANIIGTLLLRKGSKDNLNIRAAYLHLFSDAVSSVAVILGGIFIYFFDLYWVDPLLTVLISLYVLKGSWDIIKEATTVIMMGSPKSVSLREVQEDVESIPGVKNIHHVHIWMLNEKNIQFEAHVDIEDMMVSESDKLREQIEGKLGRRNITHVTLQFECDSCDTKALI